MAFGVFGVAMRHVHIAQLDRTVQILLVLVLVLIDGGLLLHQLAPFLLEDRVGGVERQRLGEDELVRRRGEGLGRLLEDERDLENKG